MAAGRIRDEIPSDRPFPSETKTTQFAQGAAKEAAVGLRAEVGQREAVGKGVLAGQAVMLWGEVRWVEVQ